MLKKRKYRLLYTSRRKGKPGPKGPTWVLVVMDQFTRRIIGFGVHAGELDGVALCRKFNKAISTMDTPTHLSSDNDPLFQYHQWQANLDILDVDDVKSVPYTPRSQ